MTDAKSRQGSHGERLASAADVLGALENGRTVAVSLPVFADPKGVGNNWLTTNTVVDGKVLDPQDDSDCVGGHAVCVTGFIPADDEDLGGYFVVRNSWGTAWASQAAARGMPLDGYGTVSASYVDRYAWEAYAF